MYKYEFYYKSTEIYSGQAHPKIILPLMRSNLIGHTIFLTSKKISSTSYFTSEKIRIGFFRLSERSYACDLMESECLQRSLPSQNHGFTSGLQTLIQSNNLLRTKKTKIQERKPNRMLLYFGISDAEERVKFPRRS